MKGNIEDRVKLEAEYIKRTGATVRTAAGIFGVSKSTVHKDITTRLQHLDMEMATEIGCIMDKHKAERHLLGGAATSHKYSVRREPNG